MSVIALVVIVALVVVVVALAAAVPRLRGRTPARGRRPARVATAPVEETEVEREGGRRPREERRLIAEGEAIREHVESRLDAERVAGVHPVGPNPLEERDDLAWQREQEERRRHPSAYGTPGAPAYVEPAHVDPAYGDAAYGAPGHVDPGYGNAAYVDPAYGNPAYGDPVVAPPAARPVLSARDQLAWQVEQDQRARYPEAYPPHRAGRVAPLGGGLQPQMPAVSDALELQLQEIAVRSRGQRPAGAVGSPRMGRRPWRSPRPRRVDGDPDDPRLAG
jgi:hypothetical protein